MPYPDPRPHAETMLFKCPGPHEWEGIKHEYIVVPDAEIPAKLAEGWALTVPEAAQVATDHAAALKANEEERARIAAELQAAGQSVEEDETSAGAGGKKAVHKGRGVWEVQDAAGAVLKTGLTKEQAQAEAGA